ncbi:Thiamine biosynthesis protein ThiC [Hyperthermus butylicus DSM 5456]|uniref:Phosphomethylpyrimidine synthase n=2 Tax=Hyperthermus butylicus TaxID=54248 RepID=A2BJK0_HYPBU|nr:Thiamine biosynthesis protein ThiC [Hyperthermus butylicus DSM 5456]
MAKTVMLEARSGSVPEEVLEVARTEGVDPNKLRVRLAEGRVIIARNIKRQGRIRLVGVGEGLTTKVNVNIGVSTHVNDIEMEKEKARIAVQYGADTIMDLSVGENLDEVRRILMEASEPLPFGTVPTYQAYIEGVRKHGGMPDEDFFLQVLERHLRDGVDFMTIHAGITRELAERALKSNRIQPIVSRGGALLAAWMMETGSENPYYRNWDYILELFAEYDAVISLGDALRPGAIADALDELQILELINNARLVERAREKGVQVMVEGPGHVPINKIVADIRLMKSLTRGAPYYVLGPLVTDIGLGYDHIAAAIGAAIAAAEGADLICYLTPAEHLSLPNPEQVKEGLIAARIAAHAGDIVKLGRRVMEPDIKMSIHRARLEWNKMFKLSLDPERARRIYSQYGVQLPSCTMCGSYCAFLILNKYMEKTRR